MHLDPPEPRIPSILYHYTNSAGLLGIVDKLDFTPYECPAGLDFSRALQIRASDVTYLGGGTDYRIARESLSKQIAHAGFAAEPRIRALLDALGQNNDRPSDERYAGAYTYAARFFAGGNLPAKWHRLAASGGGYAIGIDTPLIGHRTVLLSRPPEAHQYFPARQRPDAPFTSLNNPRTRAVLYGSDMVARDVASSLVNTLSEQDEAHALDLEEARRALEAIAARLRTTNFQHEQEWRILVDVRAADPSEFRPGSMGLVPYRNLAIIGTPAREVAAGAHVWGPISRLVVGPGPHQAYRIDGARRLLAANGLDPDVVCVAEDR